MSIIDNTRALDTTSIPSGGTPSQNIIETFSSVVGARLYDTMLLDRVTRVPATSAYRMRSISTTAGVPQEPTVQSLAQGAALTFGNFAYAETRSSLTTLRVGCEVSNELLADSAVRESLAANLAGELQEQMCQLIALACGTQMDQSRHNRSAITSSIPSAAALHALVFGCDVAQGGQVAGAAFAGRDYADLVIICSPVLLFRMAIGSTFGTTFTNDEVLDYRCLTAQYAHPTILGVPVVPLRTWISPQTNNTTPYVTPHLICVNARRIVLAEQPLVISIDSESKAAENQTRIVASVRCAAFLENTMAATALTVKSS